MFEDYIQDAYYFYKCAIIAQNEREAKMFYRASVFCAASAMEAFMNFIGETFRQGGTLEKDELAFINDKVLEFIPSKLKSQEKIKFNPIDEKIKFIIKRFDVSINLSTSLEWNSFISFKDLRDSLIHPKNISDERNLLEYQVSIKNGLNSIIDIINAISLKLFTKPLRKSVAELKI